MTVYTFLNILLYVAVAGIAVQVHDYVKERRNRHSH